MRARRRKHEPIEPNSEAELPRTGVSQYSTDAAKRPGGSWYEPLIARQQRSARVLIPEIKKQLDQMEARMKAGDATLRKRVQHAVDEKRAFLLRLVDEMKNGLEVSS